MEKEEYVQNPIDRRRRRNGRTKIVESAPSKLSSASGLHNEEASPLVAGPIRS